MQWYKQLLQIKCLIGLECQGQSCLLAVWKEYWHCSHFKTCEMYYESVVQENSCWKLNDQINPLFYLIPDYESRQEPNILMDFWVKTL